MTSNKPMKLAALLAASSVFLFANLFSYPATALAQQPAAPQTAVSADPDAANGLYPGYLTWPEVKAEIVRWSADYPRLVTVSSLGKTYEGRDIPVVRLSAAPGGSDTPEVMILSGIHPREQQPVIAVSHLIDKLLAGYGKDPYLTRLLDQRVIYIVPIFNVDGKVYDMQHGNGTTRGADWRKNRDPNTDGSIGTDLNRNFGVRWGGDRGYDPEWGASTIDKQSNIYEGRGPVSEPEDHCLTEFLAAHKSKMRAFLDLHSPLHVINLPGYAIGPDYDRYMALVNKMRSDQQDPYPYSDLKRDEQPSAAPRAGNSGLTYTWAFYTQGIYAMNMEFAPPSKHKSGVYARYAPPQEIVTEYERNIEKPLLDFIDIGGSLPPSHTGSATCDASAAALSGPLTPGATVSWTPSIQGPWDFAVLVSENANIVVPSEYRKNPLAPGFTLQVDSGASAGVDVPMSLYIWDRDRGESVVKFHLTVAAH